MPSLVRPLAVVGAMVALHYAIQAITAVLMELTSLVPAGETGELLHAVEHHLWQLLLALVAIGVLSRGHWGRWGLNLRRRSESTRIIKRFTLVYGAYFIGIGFVLQWLLFPAPDAPGPLEPGQIAGRLLFGFVLVGISEEVLFRGLIHTALAGAWTGAFWWRSWAMPTAGIIAALIFTLAHVRIDLQPLEVTYSLPQLLMAFVLGLFYSAAYHRTGSLLAPVVCHNLSDGLLWASEYALIALEGGSGG